MPIKEFELPENLRSSGISSMKILDDKRFGRYVKATFNNIPLTATFNPEDITGTMKRFKNEATTYIKDKSVLTDLILTMTTEVEKYIEECVMSQTAGGAGAGSGGTLSQQQELCDAIIMKYTSDPERMEKIDVQGEGTKIDTENTTEGDTDDTTSSTPTNAALWESVKIAGSYYLTSYDPIQKRVKITNSRKEKSGRNILPYGEAGGTDPYVFKDKEDLEQYIERSKMENLGTLFKKVQRCVKMFYDTDNQAYINLVSADIIFTYFQDRLGKTHYLFIYGEPGTGKGAVLDTITQLGYRAADVTSITRPVLYRIMGSVERGQVVMLIDEANKLEDDELLLNVLKVGYKGSQRVPRMVDNERNIIEWFYAYCFKVIAAEKLPAHWKTGGFI